MVKIRCIEKIFFAGKRFPVKKNEKTQTREKRYEEKNKFGKSPGTVDDHGGQQQPSGICCILAAGQRDPGCKIT